MFPTAEHGRNFPTRVRIEKKTLDLIVPEKATREEVLLQMGEPDVAIKEERVFAYYWKLTVGYLVVFLANREIPVGRTYVVLVEFDDRGIVKRCETKDEYFLSLEKLYRWSTR